MSSSFAGQVNPEIEQLRQEVNELRAMLQADIQTQKSLSPEKVEQVAPVATQAPQSIQQVLTKSGTEFNLYGYIRADASYQIKGHLRCITILVGFHLNIRQKNLPRRTNCTVRFM